jgi:murein DD-endopeptidase MepM/ murein hydrolase activator NlpD
VVGRTAVLAIGVLLAGATGCFVGGYGVTHRVKPGENLYRIGQAYGYDHMELARINRLSPPYVLKPGDEIFIPDADRELPVGLITPRGANAAPPTVENGVPSKSRAAPGPTRHQESLTQDFARAPEARGVAKNARFSWPVRGKLIQPFSGTSSAPHDGIDVATMPGSAILAAADGKVIFSDRLSSYGNVIIVEHSGGFTTVYAHNERNLVRKGSRIRRGEKIATLGASGRARTPHLHFEVRKDNIARNPLYYLPR